MISHKYKCIFIHIPATGGSVIEQAIIGKDWQQIDPRTKHLTPDLAKLHYKQYWNEYFKFTFVRNPFDWAVSMYSKTRPKDLKGISFKKFLQLLEKYKSLSWECPLNRIDIPLYKNCEELDFVGKFENLEEDCNKIAKKLNIKISFPTKKIHSNKREKKYNKYYDNETLLLVSKIFKKDLDTFRYKY